MSDGELDNPALLHRESRGVAPRQWWSPACGRKREGSWRIWSSALGLSDTERCRALYAPGIVSSAFVVLPSARGWRGGAAGREPHGRGAEVDIRGGALCAGGVAGGLVASTKPDRAITCRRWCQTGSCVLYGSSSPRKSR